jgi:membrane protein DedA with SNARE-associated domain
MSFLQGFHGTVAGILICILLFVDEAGIPLPFAPNEVLLLLTGVLIASNAFSLPVILPLTFAAMLLGMVAGYVWARTIGEKGLATVAEHFHATRAYERVQERLKQATPWGIAGARLLPGLRPYTTLVAGAARVSPRTFLEGAVPALFLWNVVWILIGMLVGLPFADFFTHVEKLLVRGVVLLALGAIAWLAIRDASPDRAGGLSRVTPRLRPTLALIVDAAIVFSIVGGLFAIGRAIINLDFGGWVEIVVAALGLIVLLVIGRRAETPGEKLFSTHYWHLLAPHPR